VTENATKLLGCIELLLLPLQGAVPVGGIVVSAVWRRSRIVEGDALAPGSGGDVLDELPRVLHSISAGGDGAH